MHKPIDDPNIVFLIYSHIPDVVRICADSYEQPWDADAFKTTLKHFASIGLVYMLDQQIIAYMVYELHRDRMLILSLGVDPRFRRKGFGTKMINRLKDKLRDQGRRILEIDSCETCLSAHLFLKSNGFRAVAINKDQYPPYDGYVFQFKHRENDVPLDIRYPAVG